MPVSLQDPKAVYDFIGQLSHNSADSSDIVYRVRHRESGQAYACKCISKHQAYGHYGGSCMRCALLPSAHLHNISWEVLLGSEEEGASAHWCPCVPATSSRCLGARWARADGVAGRRCLFRIGASAGAGWKHEAQMLARCADHANIVTLHEVIEDAHYVYIVMEECEGAGLSAQQ